MRNEKTNREMPARFVRENFNIRCGDIPGNILRRLRIKGNDPDPEDLAEPRFLPIHDLMADIIALYEERLNVKIEIVDTDEYARLLCRKDCDYRLCIFLEYVFDAETRTVYIDRYEYDSRVLTFLNYADAVLRSRGLCRRRIRNIRLFRIHAYPPRMIVATNRLYTLGNPFLRHGNRYLMYFPDDLWKTRFWFNRC